MRASGVREESTDLITSCQKRVDMVLDGPYGTWFDKKIEALLVNDPFVTLQRGDTKEDLMKRLRSSMLFHCKFLKLKVSVVFFFFCKSEGMVLNCDRGKN